MSDLVITVSCAAQPLLPAHEGPDMIQKQAWGAVKISLAESAFLDAITVVDIFCHLIWKYTTLFKD